MATLFFWASLAGVLAAELFFAVAVVVDFFTAGVFLAAEVLAGAFRAVVFWTGSDAFFAALFLAAAERWGADFLGADVAMVSYPLPSSETEADWSQDSRPRVHHVPARRADRGHTVVGSSSPLDVLRVTTALRTSLSVTDRPVDHPL
jgi:hypothetical protein